jgi:hypothetical protein
MRPPISEVDDRKQVPGVIPMKWSGFLTIVGLAVLCGLLSSSCMIFGSSYRSPNACENCSQQEGADACCVEDAGECADCGGLKGSP